MLHTTESDPSYNKKEDLCPAYPSVPKFFN